jgi:hypothetical protein
MADSRMLMQRAEALHFFKHPIVSGTASFKTEEAAA